MKKILLACDLDNTLIHSYKQKQDEDVCIEWIQGREQGFISRNAFNQIECIEEKSEFVPVTTRSIEQYLRIKWGKKVKPQYAITTNGAVLLDGEAPDVSWKNESESMLSGYKEELADILNRLENGDDYIRCRMVDSMYVFAYRKEGVDTDNKVKSYADRTSLKVVSSGKKIYFFPPEFNKGNALIRLAKRLEADIIIAAGDSEIDIPMLELADIAYCKNGIICKISNPNKRCFTDEKDLLKSVINEVSSIKEVSNE